MKTLILTQCHLKSDEQGRMLGTNLELMQRLNPGYDVLLIDNASLIEPERFLPEGCWRMDYSLDAAGDDETVEGSFNIEWFEEAIGHFSHKFDGERIQPARDGPGRAIMTGIRIAQNSGYDRLVYCEDDCLFAKPLEEGFARMQKPVAMLPRTRWGYLETNVMWFADLKWLERFDLIGRYDWPNQKQGPGREGERVYEAILGEHLQVLPFKGGRGENFISERNLTHVFPNGIDFITHVSRETHGTILRMNGHGDLVPKLVGP